MQELPFLHSARLMLIDICMRFREDSFRGLQVTERTQFVTDRRTDRQTDAWGNFCTDSLFSFPLLNCRTIVYLNLLPL